MHTEPTPRHLPPPGRTFLLLSLAFFALNFYSLVIHMGLDQTLVAVVARGLRRGLVPYVDLWDNNAPGIFFVYRLAFSLFGETVVAINWIDLIYRWAAMGAIYALGRNLFDHRAAVAGALVYLLGSTVEYQVFWLQAQRDTFLVLPLVLTYLAILRYRRRPRLALPYVAGLLLGMAGLLKPNAGATIPFYVFLLVGLPRTKPAWAQAVAPALLFGVGLATAPAMAGLWLLQLGAFQDAWYAVVVSNVYYAAVPDAYGAREYVAGVAYMLRVLGTQVPFLAAATLTGVWFLGLEGRWHDRHNLLIWLVFLFAAVFAQTHLFPYHSIAMLPAAAPIAGFGLSRLTACLTSRNATGSPS